MLSLIKHHKSENETYQLDTQSHLRDVIVPLKEQWNNSLNGYTFQMELLQAANRDSRFVCLSFIHSVSPATHHVLVVEGVALRCTCLS